MPVPQHCILILDLPHTIHCCVDTGRKPPTSLIPVTHLLLCYRQAYMPQSSQAFAAAARAMHPFSSGGLAASLAVAPEAPQPHTYCCAAAGGTMPTFRQWPALLHPQKCSPSAWSCNHHACPMRCHIAHSPVLLLQAAG